MASRVFIDTGAVIDAAGLQNVAGAGFRQQHRDQPGHPEHPPGLADLSLGLSRRRHRLCRSALVGRAFRRGRLGRIAADPGGQLLPAGRGHRLGADDHRRQRHDRRGQHRAARRHQPGPRCDHQGGRIDRHFRRLANLSGGRLVQTSQLVDANGQVVNVGYANPNDTYIGVYSGFTTTQPRWGISQTYVDPILSGAHMEGQYTEGRDAGALSVKSSVVVLDGQVFADAFAGPQQTLDAQPGTATGSVFGDLRNLQGAPSQLPAGGYLNVQGLGVDTRQLHRRRRHRHRRISGLCADPDRFRLWPIDRLRPRRQPDRAAEAGVLGAARPIAWTSFR